MKLANLSILYLHGFLSGPDSRKARYFSEKLRAAGVKKKPASAKKRDGLTVPDLNQGEAGFADLTLSRQIEQGEQWLSKPGPGKSLIIGSSFGGLTAAWLASRNPDKVAGLVLLAPAFEFLWQLTDHNLSLAEREKWRRQGNTRLEHPAFGNRSLALKYNFLTDLESWAEENIKLHCPVILFHGNWDDVIYPAASRRVARRFSGVALHLLDDDHSLLESLDFIWSKTRAWLAALK